MHRAVRTCACSLAEAARANKLPEKAGAEFDAELENIEAGTADAQPRALPVPTRVTLARR